MRLTGVCIYIYQHFGGWHGGFPVRHLGAAGSTCAAAADSGRGMMIVFSPVHVLLTRAADRVLSGAGAGSGRVRAGSVADSGGGLVHVEGSVRDYTGASSSG